MILRHVLSRSERILQTETTLGRGDVAPRTSGRCSRCGCTSLLCRVSTRQAVLQAEAGSFIVENIGTNSIGLRAAPTCAWVRLRPGARHALGCLSVNWGGG